MLARIVEDVDRRFDVYFAIPGRDLEGETDRDAPALADGVDREGHSLGGRGRGVALALGEHAGRREREKPSPVHGTYPPTRHLILVAVST